MKLSTTDLIWLTDDGDAEKIDGVHVEIDSNNVEGQRGVRYTRDGACSGQLRGL